jgi:chemotaxis protein CheX
MSETNVMEPVTQSEITGMATASTEEVFSTMLGLDLQLIEEEHDSEHPMLAESGATVVSLIGLTGPWAGTGSITCSGELACLLASRFLSTDYDAVNTEVLDAVGEITNMIMGNVKTTLEDRVGAMDLSTPAVIFGQIFQTYSARIHDWLVIRFRCGKQELQVQMCLAESNPPQPRMFRFPGT